MAGKANERNTRDQHQESRPTHAVYVVEGDGDSAYWTKVGAAWANEDGEGYNISLIAQPLNGRLVIRTAKADTQKEAAR